MPKPRDIKRQSEEQKYLARKIKAIDELAKECGFDDDAILNAEFGLYPFFDKLVEKCAKLAEESSKNFCGMANEEAGCKAAASSIRHFGKTIGNE